MSKPELKLIGRGLYSLTEASRLTGIPIRRIKRWVNGYHFWHRGRRQWSVPVIGNEIGPIGGVPVLDFADLQEVRFLNAFRDQKIGWPAIRLAAAKAREVLNTEHPFSSKRFVADGRTILLEIVDETGDRKLLDLLKDQWLLERVVFQSLRKWLHYGDKDQPQWWSPLGDDRHVRVNPRRSFGAPIVSPGGIRTRILHDAYLGQGSVEAVAEWYAVEPAAVYDAVQFEEGIRHQRRAA
jgi:uncharacterized protein (DUF433 family)